VYGPQTLRRYRRETGHADPPPPGAGGGSLAFDVLDATELDLIVRGLARTVGAQAGLLAISDQAGQGVEVLAAWGAADGLDLLPGSLTDGFVGRALSFERAALEPINPHDGGLGIAGSGNDLTHGAGVAVRPAGGPAGVLCAAFSAPPPDPAETLRLIDSYGRLASLCLEQPGMLDGVLPGAELDGLTGALNYAALRHELGREVARSERHALGLSCCFIDLDRFKRVNDRYGHLHGSRMLAEVAAALRLGLRGEDTLGRYGGDEFVAILPETIETEAMALASRLRSTIQATMITGSYSPIDASIGVAQWQPGSSREQLLEAADRALRAAKAAGGGRVIGASDQHRPAGDREQPVRRLA
jgi:diguanylate cyclase (GGDEF)-like protein